MSELRHRFHGHNDGTFTVEGIQDVEPILDANKASQNSPQTSKDFRLVASIPMVVIERWIVEDGAPVLHMNGHEFDRFIKRKLRDRDNLFLRAVGRI